MNLSENQVMDIVDLWQSEDEKQWRDALASYWQNPSVKRNLEIERFIDRLDVESVRNADAESWLAFLRVYFRWKFTGNYVGKRLAGLEDIHPERLLRIKNLLFSSDPKDPRKALERARYINGLGSAGASGLLAVLFPKWFGTVDRFVVKALLEIPTLPERPKLQRMIPENLTNDNAVLLIEILRRKAAELNELFDSDEWTPRKIDMILWNFRDGRRC
jgi:hypothetical protein